MTPETLQAAIDEAERFFAKAKAARASVTRYFDHDSIERDAVKIAAVKRSSMELTRALADLRRVR